MMIRYLGFGLVLAAAVTLAACTQPAMMPNHVSALRSGKIVIETFPQHPGFLPASPGVQALAGFTAVAVGGLIGGTIVEAGVAGAEAANMKNERIHEQEIPKILRPYLGDIDTQSFDADLEAIGKKMAAEVPWLRNGVPELIPPPVWPLVKETGRQKRITQKSGVNAIAFIVPKIAFSKDLKTLYVFTPITVWAQGQNKVIFLDGGWLVAGSKLADTSPILSKSDIKTIAEEDNESVRKERAALWFADGRTRFKQALNQAEGVFAGKLKNYLTGKRATSSPYAY